MNTLPKSEPVPTLPPKQHEMLRAIISFINEKHYPPTFQELADKTGKSKTAVRNNVSDLSKKKVLLVEYATSRSIVVQPLGHSAARKSYRKTKAAA